ncbi:translation elongation factor Ts [Desulfomicrobium baculatum]|uniref:Elongation factor Ts n=1 Tax=Desulfomicrobium baculatum (strain DSM 4028 / VKM B-1378 / X) TaxID=525897 RepID=C7LR50_DESBD|nr:translation elongation factor Ts [Desulfomicrobium baculatum]ACU90456.1 translation elongation factor Ts [Desulfomicrobium baculatum DSM 4028]
MSITAAMVKDLRERTGVGMMDCKKALAECDGDEEKAIAWLREKGLSKAAKKAGRATSEGLVTVIVAADGKSAAMSELKCETDFVSKNEEFTALAEGLATLALEKKTDKVEDLPAEASDLTGLIGKIGENMQVGRLAYVAFSGEGAIGTYVHSTKKLGVLVELSGQVSPEVAKDVAMQIAAANPLCVSPDQIPAETLAQEKEIYLNQAKEEGKPAQIAEKIVEGRIRKFYQEVCLREQLFIKDDKKTIKDLLGKNAEIVRFFRFAIGA